MATSETVMLSPMVDESTTELVFLSTIYDNHSVVPTPPVGTTYAYKTFVLHPTTNKQSGVTWVKTSDGRRKVYIADLEKRKTVREESKIIKRDGYLGILKLILKSAAENTTDSTQLIRLTNALDTNPSLTIMLQTNNWNLAIAKITEMVSANIITLTDSIMIKNYIGLASSLS